MVGLHGSLSGLEVPAPVSWLPRDRRGFPVPWFVAWVDGVPDFRTVGVGKVELATKFGLCWVCGLELVHQRAAYVAGPMCGVNRVSSEPPSHVACARFAARACPFLVRPAMRRAAGETEGAVGPAGVMIERNPGVAMLWISGSLALPFDVPNGRLFRLPDPLAVEWYAQGRAASRAEVQASVESGLPVLMESAEAEGRDAVRELVECVRAFAPLLPVAA